MMLHEAVMLEIYRQALSASELASPRCQSRESNTSATAGDARCPSTESHCSANDCLTPAPTPTPTSPVGLPLTATLAPAAAAALLPPQSAAMAAYLAAAQQNHLLLTNPLAAAASLVQQATQQSRSPDAASPQSGQQEEAPALDFSRKRTPSDFEANAGSEDEEEQREQEAGEATNDDGNCPLDLSVSTRKRPTQEEQDAPTRKTPRSSDYKSPLPPGTWVPPLNPYLAAVAAANSMSPKSLDWNGAKMAGAGKLAPNEATKALEKMTEMSRLGSAVTSASSEESSTSANRSGSSRHSAWQSHWLNKGADAAKDVFKCVWCKQSFPTLATLTTHMKETQHCGVHVAPPTSGGSNNVSNQTPTRPATAATSTSSSSSSASSTASSGSAKSELNMLIKETMPLPRKLVRGAEQTRQILKCMWCGQSFRSLAEMTSHMQETQHYTNIISQEQIISWKSGDEKPSSERPANGGGSNAVASTTAPTPTVSAVLTCKVCDQAFPTLKELSTHMAQQAHYKEPPNNTSVSPPAPPAQVPASKRGGRQAREKRKKSLPVRKLLEMERNAAHDFKSAASLDSALKPLRDFAAATKITCEKCGSKIETALFVEHIRKCLGDSIPIPPRRPPPTSERLPSPRTPSSPLCEKPGMGSSGAPSVLNAIEQLIEKSFETRGRMGVPHGGGYADAGTPLGASILKRLGIDDSSDYTKPLMDVQTMQLLRSYSARDRSASESSSTSRVDSAYTPERQQPTPRRTPEVPPPPPPAPPTTIKSEPLDNTELDNVRSHIAVKKEFSMQAQEQVEAPRTPHSPSVASERSSTPPPPPADTGSLLALNSMFDQLNSLKQLGSETNNNNNNNNNQHQVAAKKPNAHPLAALQKLCETTDPPAANTRSSSTASATANGNDLVAFSWACNEAVLSAADPSIIKCSFCDTPFCSKGAYRHHLSKVHFVKDDGGGESPAASVAAQSPKSALTSSPKSRSPMAQSPNTQANTHLQPQTPTINPYDESPQSKFLKYTELAKQLSSKNA
ncbi:protein tiptop [Scaptodrosophila lebanonensis]|uniref:Protein tiptop n=1 Tax=Drosophila lebanonensis TaxID=7225 RepID=A0A6J2TLL1_DROLE|nr:protein tiptop [Scaptodrosophila lebanonensis]